MHYILRIKDESERQLFVRRMLYIGIRRDWSRNSKILFVKRLQSGDAFIGSGMPKKIAGLDELDGDERRLCMENNWYGKMLFERLAKFQPPVDLQNTSLAQKMPALLHGLEITDDEVSAIEKLVRVRINI